MLWKREPVLITSLVRAAVLLVSAFGLKLEPEQIGAVVLFTEAVLAVVVRSTVTSPATAVVSSTPVATPVAAAAS